MSADSTTETTDAAIDSAPLTFVNEATGEPVVFDEAPKADEVFVGNILTREDGSGKHHYQVKSVDNFPQEPAVLVPARSNVKKVVLLLGTLAVLWFVIDGLIKYFTS